MSKTGSLISDCMVPVINYSSNKHLHAQIRDNNKKLVHIGAKDLDSITDSSIIDQIVFVKRTSLTTLENSNYLNLKDRKDIDPWCKYILQYFNN